MTFLWLATPYQILIFSNLILHNFILVSKSNSSVYNKFTRHEQVLAWRNELIVLWTLNRQVKIFLRNSSDFKLFVFLRIRYVRLKICVRKPRRAIHSRSIFLATAFFFAALYVLRRLSGNRKVNLKIFEHIQQFNLLLYN